MKLKFSINKNKMMVKYYLLLLTCFLFNSQSLAAQSNVIHLVGEPFPPATNTDGTGQQFEFVKALYQPLGYEFVTHVFPYKRAIKRVESGQADIIIGIFQQNSLNLLYSMIPHDADNLFVIYPGKSAIHWQGVSSLMDRHITVTLGTKFPFEQYLTGIRYSLDEVSSRKQALEKLMHQRTDFIIDTEGSYTTPPYIENHNRLLTQKIGYIGIYAAFSNTKKGQALKKIWDSEFISFFMSAKARNIYQKWGLLREYQVSLAFFKKEFNHLIEAN